MNLTDNEKRDIVNLLEQNKKLPDKYRFLLFDESKQVELNWNGKSDEITIVVLPFQIIEQIDEPRHENVKIAQGSFDFDLGRQMKGWTNKLIWGDNKFILSSLKNGPMRDEIEKEGGIKLIYIDPPFDVQADFSTSIEVGNSSYLKKPNVLEQIAYRDTWGLGADSYLSMIYERLAIMKDLLADDGSIYVHCDYRLSGRMRLVLNEVFGEDNFTNEIIWQGSPGSSIVSGKFVKTHDSIFYLEKIMTNLSLILNILKWENRQKHITETKMKMEYLDGIIVEPLERKGILTTLGIQKKCQVMVIECQKKKHYK